VKTDANGAYLFDNIAEGSYLIMAKSLDFLTACYPSADPHDGCGQVDVSRDQKRTDVNMTLPPAAIARGRVIDQRGAAVANAAVRVTLERTTPAPNPYLRVRSAYEVKTGTDGAFEMRGVWPGKWYLEVDLPFTTASMRPPIVFYPGVLSEDEATRVEFFSGRATSNLVFTVPSTAANVLNVSVVAGPLAIGDVRAAIVRTAPLISKKIDLDSDGRGTINGMIEGRYFISARGWINDKAWAAFEVASFFAPSLDVSLRLEPAGTIKGRIVAERGGLPPLDGVVAAAIWVSDGIEINPMIPDQVPVESDGSFTIGGLFGTREVKLIGLSPEWRVHSIVQGRSEIPSTVDVRLDTTLNITIVVSKQ